MVVIIIIINNNILLCVGGGLESSFFSSCSCSFSDTGTSSKAQGDEETAAVVAADLEHHDNRTSCDEKQCLPQSPPIVDETAKAWSSEKKPQRDSIDDLVDELQTLQVSNEGDQH